MVSDGVTLGVVDSLWVRLGDCVSLGDMERDWDAVAVYEGVTEEICDWDPDWLGVTDCDGESDIV